MGYLYPILRRLAKNMGYEYGISLKLILIYYQYGILWDINMDIMNTNGGATGGSGAVDVHEPRLSPRLECGLCVKGGGTICILGIISIKKHYIIIILYTCIHI